jgi:hypothetical protein
MALGTHILQWQQKGACHVLDKMPEGLTKSDWLARSVVMGSRGMASTAICDRRQGSQTTAMRVRLRFELMRDHGHGKVAVALHL